MIRFGILGAARIAPEALVRPAREVEGVEVAAIAAREEARAEAFARSHRIERVHGSYAELLADPGIDAVYIPLPNGLHAEWTLRAIAAGKHVLCEKPFTSNRREAEEVAAAADKARRSSGLVVMEAFHYRYHPLAARIDEILHGARASGTAPGSGGELGPLREVEVSACVPMPLFGDIRYQYDLAGGATMDLGCYALNALRFFGGETPRVLSASAKTLRRDPRVDRALSAELAFPGGAHGRVHISMWSSRLLSIRARVRGERGELSVVNFMAPHLFHRLRVRAEGRTRRERVAGRATYFHQLVAFAAAVEGGGYLPTSAGEAVINMGIIDDVYRAAGLPIRGQREGD